MLTIKVDRWTGLSIALKRFGLLNLLQPLLAPSATILPSMHHGSPEAKQGMIKLMVCL